MNLTRQTPYVPRNKILKEFIIEHEVILRWIDAIISGDHKYYKHDSLNDFKVFLIDHLSKEDTILYPFYHKHLENVMSFEEISEDMRSFFLISNTALEILEEENPIKLRNLAAILKIRILFEENVLFCLYDKHQNGRGDTESSHSNVIDFPKFSHLLEEIDRVSQ